jgi:hypothetical protein
MRTAMNTMTTNTSTTHARTRTTRSRTTRVRAVAIAAIAGAAALIAPQHGPQHGTRTSPFAPAAASAQGWAPGVHLYEVPDPRFIWAEPRLSEDGTAVGVTLFDFSVSPTARTGAMIRPSGVTQFTTSETINDLSDGGSFTTGYVSRRSQSGVIDTLLPGVTRPQDSSQRSVISGDGRVVGMSVEGTSFNLPSVLYRWTPETGTQLLGSYGPGAFQTSVQDISRDGRTMVGGGTNVLIADSLPWVWREGQGFTILPTIPDSPFPGGLANATNSDGTIIVGSVTPPALFLVAAVWRNGALTTLPPIDGYNSSFANDISDDGSIILGGLRPNGGGGIEAVWTAETNWVPTLDYLRMRGVQIPSYVTLGSSWQISGEGTTFSGLVRDDRTGAAVLGVFVIPSPGAVPVLAVVIMFSSRRRRIRRVV